MSGGVIVRPDDLHAIGYCNRGARAWCQRYGLDWAQFVINGVPVEVIAATGDAMGLRLAKHVREARSGASE